MNKNEIQNTAFFFFKSHAQFAPQKIIDADILSSWSIFVADLDGDDFIDVIASEGSEDRM
ncbi:MAG: hypothetical protein ACI9AT_000499 [Ulvibacter sp.]|jgi:hypothetical protein